MLKLLKALLFDSAAGVRSPGHAAPLAVVLEPSVHASISALSASDPAVLVRSLAAELLSSSRVRLYPLAVMYMVIAIPEAC